MRFIRALQLVGIILIGKLPFRRATRELGRVDVHRAMCRNISWHAKSKNERRNDDVVASSIVLVLVLLALICASLLT